MKKIFLIFLSLTVALTACGQSFIRTFFVVSENSTFPPPYNCEWMQGESVRFEVTAKEGNFYVALTNGSIPVLKMWSGNVVTQLYANKTGTLYEAASGKVYVDLQANEANISPTGAYNYAIGVYDGTNYMGVIAQGRATVRGHPFGSSVGYVGAFNAFPYVPTNDGRYLSAVTNKGATINGSPITNGAAITVSAGSATNGLNSASMIESTSNAVVLATNHLTVIVRTNYGGGAGTITNIASSNAGFIVISAPGGPIVYLSPGTNVIDLLSFNASTAAMAAAISAAGTWTVSNFLPTATWAAGTGSLWTAISARLQSNVWAAADSTTNFVRRTGDTIRGNLFVTNSIFSYGDGYVQLSPGSPARGGIVTFVADDLSIASLRMGTGGGYLTRDENKMWDAGTDGSGSGLDADLLDGLDSTAFFQSIATQGVGNVVTNLRSGGGVITQQMGTITGGGGGAVAPRIQGFHRWEGSAAGWHVASLPVGVDDISTDGSTTYDLYSQFIYGSSTVTITNKLYGSFSVPVTNNFPFQFRANQAGAVAVVSLNDGSAVKVITQSLAAASTTYITNAPIAGGAATNFMVEFRYSTTNAANPVRIGVGQ